MQRDARGSMRPTAQKILYEWRHTDGGPATNFLAHWTSSALVISVDLDALDRGGRMLAVWGSTETAARRFDRLGRPLSKNALLGLTGRRWRRRYVEGGVESGDARDLGAVRAGHGEEPCLLRRARRCLRQSVSHRQ